MRCHRRRPSSSVVGCVGCALSGSCQAAAAMVGQGQGCPFGLHALLPVPDAILDLGPTHPEALAWLAAHWGVTNRLRQVNVLKRPEARPAFAEGPCGDRLRALRPRQWPWRGDPDGRDRHAGGAAASCGRRPLLPVISERQPFFAAHTA